MNKSGPIIIVDDDIEDHEILAEVFKELNYPNEIIFFEEGREALDYLIEKEGDVFLVFSDMNMPKMTGIEFRKNVLQTESLAAKFIPFLFFTTSAGQSHIHEAYENAANGFFIKPTSFKAIKETVSMIVNYWNTSLIPS